MEVVAVTEQQSKGSVRSIKGPAEFQRFVREALELMRRLDAIESNRLAVIAAVDKKAESDRLPLLARYNNKMNPVMAYIETIHPDFLKGGVDDFVSGDVIVSFHTDDEGILVIPDEAALVTYLWRRPKLRYMVEVVRSLASATEFKQWLLDNPNRLPPACVVRRHSILFTLKLSAAERKARRNPRVVLERFIT